MRGGAWAAVSRMKPAARSCATRPSAVRLCAAVAATLALLALVPAPADAWRAATVVVTQDEDGAWNVCIGYAEDGGLGVVLSTEGILASVPWIDGGAEYAGALHHCPAD